MKIYVRKGLKINLWIILVRKLHLLKDILNVSRICMRSACLAHCFWGYLLHSTMSWFNLLFVCLICILWPETLARFVPVYITHRNIYNISMESCVLYAIWSAITAAICAESAFRIIIGKNKKNPLKKKDTRSQAYRKNPIKVGHRLRFGVFYDTFPCFLPALGSLWLGLALIH